VKIELGAPARAQAMEPPASKKKLSYKEQRELEKLPAKIAALEAEEKLLAERIADPAFYQIGSVRIAETLERVEQVKAELLDVYARWAELDERS
jgi:ATP-binding cassette subfamily F protein uup